MSGINRIKINGGFIKDNDMRVIFPKAHIPLTNHIYRSIFNNLESGDVISQVSQYSELGKMDSEQGIDIILTFQDGTITTLQEKILSWHESTLTVETLKGSGWQGAWDYCKARYYFIGYSREWGYRDNKDDAFKPYDNPIVDFQDWILVDFSLLKQDGTIKWQPPRKNKRDGRTADFKWVYFDDIPSYIVIARMGNKINEPQIITQDAEESPFMITINVSNDKWDRRKLTDLVSWLSEQGDIDYFQFWVTHNNKIALVPFPNHRTKYSVKMIRALLSLFENDEAVKIDRIFTPQATEPPQDNATEHKVGAQLGLMDMPQISHYSNE